MNEDDLTIMTKQNTFERHAQTVLAAVVVLIIGWVGFTILDIKESQSEIQSDQKLVALQLVYIKETLDNNSVDNTEMIRQLERYMDTIWPRLRADEQNIVTLKNKIEELCKCTVVLEEPERF